MTLLSIFKILSPLAIVSLGASVSQAEAPLDLTQIKLTGEYTCYEFVSYKKDKFLMTSCDGNSIGEYEISKGETKNGRTLFKGKERGDIDQIEITIQGNKATVTKITRDWIFAFKKTEHKASEQLTVAEAKPSDKQRRQSTPTSGTRG